MILNMYAHRFPPCLSKCDLTYVHLVQLLRLEDDLDEWAQLREQPLDGLEKLRAMHTKAIAVLDERHILLLRLNKLIVDGIALFMGSDSTQRIMMVLM